MHSLGYVCWHGVWKFGGEGSRIRQWLSMYLLLNFEDIALMKYSES